MATVAPPTGQAPAQQPRLRSRLKDFGREVTYKIAGLPIAARAAIERSEAGPGCRIRRAYARRFWRPRRSDEFASLALALFIWPFALIGLEAAFLARNGATVARRSNRSMFRQMIDQVRLYVMAGVLPPWYYIFELHDRPSIAYARNFIYRWESKGGVFRLFKEGRPGSAIDPQRQGRVRRTLRTAPGPYRAGVRARQRRPDRSARGRCGI